VPRSADVSVFFANTANFPWRSHALWFSDQMRRWGYVGADVDPIAASAIFRPDVFVQAAGPLGLAVPEAWVKSEGSHSAVWLMPATPAPIPMGPDRLMDDALFDPANLDKWYPPRTLLKSFWQCTKFHPPCLETEHLFLNTCLSFAAFQGFGVWHAACLSCFALTSAAVASRCRRLMVPMAGQSTAGG
jgi:hypothetical protein